MTDQEYKTQVGKYGSGWLWEAVSPLKIISRPIV